MAQDQASANRRQYGDRNFVQIARQQAVSTAVSILLTSEGLFLISEQAQIIVHRHPRNQPLHCTISKHFTCNLQSRSYPCTHSTESNIFRCLLIEGAEFHLHSEAQIVTIGANTAKHIDQYVR